MVKTSKKEKKQIPLVIGNWKMNPQTLGKAETLFADIKKALNKTNATAQVVIAPPALFIALLQRLSSRTRVKVGAQDVFYEQAGAFTGEIAVSMLKSFEVSHVILGHSERRAQGESNETVHKKTDAVLKGGLIAVVCVGEKARDTQGDYFSFIETQLQSIFAGIQKTFLNRLVIAYEPIWAIGTGKHATAEDVQEMKLFIQKIISDTFDRTTVSKIKILYGGSVSKDNAEEILTVGHADGFLVGGASLKASEFAEIIKIADTYAKV